MIVSIAFMGILPFSGPFYHLLTNFPRKKASKKFFYSDKLFSVGYNQNYGAVFGGLPENPATDLNEERK